METKFYNVKVGRYSKKGVFIEEISFIVKTSNYPVDISNLYREKYTGFDVKVDEIESAPVVVEIPKKEEKTQMVEKPIRYIQKSIHQKTLCSEIGDGLEEEINDAVAALSELNCKIDNIKSKAIAHVKIKYGTIVVKVEVEHFRLNENYVDFKITLDETVYSELVKSE